MYPTQMTKHPMKIYRDKEGVRAADLADRAKTTKQTIYRIENGVVDPSLNMIRRICRASGGELSANVFMVGAT